jgi:hypothetical protein
MSSDRVRIYIIRLSLSLSLSLSLFRARDAVFLRDDVFLILFGIVVFSRVSDACVRACARAREKKSRRDKKKTPFHALIGQSDIARRFHCS